MEKGEHFAAVARIRDVGSLAFLSDRDLLSRARSLARAERRLAADLLAHLAEIHRRGCAVRAGFPSLFMFCVSDLKLSHGAAYARLQAVRAADRHPEIYVLLREGELNMSTVALIADHLASRPDLLLDARGKSKREVERMIADLQAIAVRPDKISFVTSADSAHAALSLASAPASVAQAPAPAVVAGASIPFAMPVAAEVMAEIRFTVPEAFLADLERLRALLWHKFPSGKIADVLQEAVSEFLKRRDPARARKQVSPRPGDPNSRRVPAAVKRAVQLRDGRRCAFVAADGRRCQETRGLEVDHVEPFALGGASDDPENLRLLCRAHNQHEARRVFGLTG